MVSNGLARDQRLSFKARGLALYLLSHTEGWETSIRAIAKANDVGREQVASGLRELEKFGYLRRQQGRDTQTGVLGDAEYVIQCEPFEDHEPPGGSRGPGTRPRLTRPQLAQPHKKTSSKNNISEKTHPSGGDGSAAPQGPGVTVEDARPTPEEEPMPTATDPGQAQLFDVESPEPPPAEARKRQGAQLVVAAYVKSWRQHNAEGEPLRADKGRIARDARALLAKGEATEEELVAAAVELGTGSWANIATQLKILRRGRSGRLAGNVPPVAQEDPGWAEGERRQDAARASAPVDPVIDDLRARYLRVGAA